MTKTQRCNTVASGRECTQRDQRRRLARKNTKRDLRSRQSSVEPGRAQQALAEVLLGVAFLNQRVFPGSSLLVVESREGEVTLKHHRPATPERLLSRGPQCFSAGQPLPSVGRCWPFPSPSENWNAPLPSGASPVCTQRCPNFRCVDGSNLPGKDREAPSYHPLLESEGQV